MLAFDREHAGALRQLWFLGDVHGHFDHIEVALSNASETNALPSWLIFLGDVDIDLRPLREILAPMQVRYPAVQVAFIHGNHDADTHEHWACLHDCGDAQILHGWVLDLGGVRVAGLGGNFLGRVWAPPSAATFTSKAASMKGGPYRWRDGQQPNPKFHGGVVAGRKLSHLDRRRQSGARPG